MTCVIDQSKKRAIGPIGIKSRFFTPRVIRTDDMNQKESRLYQFDTNRADESR
jgi:hypothetical protein